MADNSLGAKTGVPVVQTTITPWASATLTVSGLTTTSVVVKRRQVGDTIEYKGTFGGATSAAPITLNLPAGDTIDTTRLSTPSGANVSYLDILGVAKAYLVSPNLYYQATIYYNTTSSVRFFESAEGSNVARNDVWGSAVPGAWSSAGNHVEFSFSVPTVEAALTATTVYGAGLATSVKSGLTPATATLGKIRVTAGNGYGSTNTNIRRFTTSIDSVGSDIVYADSATLGGTFTIATSGVYAMSYLDFLNATSSIGISRNTASLTTNIVSIAASERIALGTTPGANLSTSVSITTYLAAGDVIRAHTDATASGASASLASFTIQRLA